MKYSIVVADYMSGQPVDCFQLDADNITEAYSHCFDYCCKYSPGNNTPGEHEPIKPESYLTSIEQTRHSNNGVYYWDEIWTFYICGDSE